MSSAKRKAFSEVKPEEWIRGANLANVEQRCMALCAEYIGGSWTAAQDPLQDIHVKRLAGGLTNQMYYVRLADRVTTGRSESSNKTKYQEDQPQEVVIKFYQPKLAKTTSGENERLNDTVILVLTSQLGIGPKVYGIFDQGVIQAYYRHVPFKAKHQADERLLRELMQKLATINLLPVPITKRPGFKVQFMRKSVESAFAEFDMEAKIQRYQLETLTKHDLRLELDEFDQILANASNPLVFCHNDFRSSNLMVTESDGLVVCDFEYCSYGLRGHDLANFLLEWGQGGESNEDWGQWHMPTDPVIAHCAQLYLHGCDLVQPGYSAKPGNSVHDIVRDVKVCLLENLLFVVAFMLNQREAICEAIEFDQEEHLKIPESTYAFYWQVKQLLKEQRII